MVVVSSATVMTHLTFPLLVLWLGVTVSTVVNLQKRIINGKPCDKTERLYHVSLSTESDGKPGDCGGSLISKQWVLTAAHCKDEPMYAVVGVHPGQGKAVEIDEKDIFPHPKDDIMLLKLPKPVTDIFAHIEPVVLPTCKDKDGKLNKKPQDGDEVQLAGHGCFKIDPKTKEKLHKYSHYYPSHLQCGLMKVVPCDHSETDQCFSEKPFAPQENRLCYHDANVDECKGDSGGGVIYDEKIYAVHIGGCDHAFVLPAVSLRVCSYIEWINEKINE